MADDKKKPMQDGEKTANGPESELRNEGEGSRSAARRYDAGAERMARSGAVDDLAREAAEALDGPEGAELLRAEEEGRNAESLPEDDRPTRPTARTRPLAVVTGASSGIGLSLARQFARHGFDLIVAAEDDAIGEATRSLATEDATATVQPIQVDLRTYDGVEKLVRRIEADGRPLAAVAINAGVGVGGDFARGTSLDDELSLIELNVLSTVHLAKRVAARMVERGSGRILFTASIAGIMPTPLEAVYGASKAFVLSFSASLHSELEGTGVTVTALMPGPTDTKFFERAGLADRKVAEKAEENDPDDVARMGFEALMQGKERVVAGNASVKFQGAAARFLPERVKASMHKKMAQSPRSK